MAGSRIELARTAAKAVLKTLTWKDQVGFVLFSDDVGETREPVFATDDVIPVIEAWIDENIVAFGSTIFFEPLKRALDMINTNASCTNIILFLTDGIAEFTPDNYLTISTMIAKHNTVLFTYALGDGADTEITKKLACENDGVFYKVPDGGDLGKAMSGYYTYFAAAAKSYTVPIEDSHFVRWVLYNDFATGMKLYLYYIIDI
jgi:hypothetical protein